jgi:hypothetical protein
MTISILVGLTYAILAVSGASGIAWVIPAIVAGAAYSLVGVFVRPR